MHHYTHTKHPIALSRLLAWAQARGKRVLEGNTCGSAWAYAFACKTNHVWANLCGSRHMCYRNSSLHNWICMSVAWIWVSTLGQVFSMLTMCGLKTESGCNPKWTELACFTIVASFFLLSPLKKQNKNMSVFPIPHVALSPSIARVFPLFPLSLSHCQSFTAFSSPLPCSISHL